MERSSFDVFKSNICHLVKNKGELTFIRDMLCSDEVKQAVGIVCESGKIGRQSLSLDGR